MVISPSHPPLQSQPIESGDRLSPPEFEHRYPTAPHIKKAELIEGVVYVASPLRFTPTPNPTLSRVMAGSKRAKTTVEDISLGKGLQYPLGGRADDYCGEKCVGHSPGHRGEPSPPVLLHRKALAAYRSGIHCWAN
jgi:hypothetical protein